jgi:hypothetical protein
MSAPTIANDLADGSSSESGGLSSLAAAERL